MIKVRLKPNQGIKVGLKTVYLYDETLIADQVNKAKEWAIKTDGKVQEEGVDVDYSSKYYAGLSKESEEKAKQSEINTKTSELNASESAKNADADAENAAESAGLAYQSEVKAKESELKATQEANASAESAYQSQQSALASYEYASNAEEDAKNALETLGHVLESEERTRISEKNAKSSETNAKNSADEASQFVLECQAIKESLGVVYVFKGSVNTIADLPENANIGDVYDVLDSGTNYAWTGDRWDSLGASFDLSEYAKKEYVDSTEQEIIQNFMDADTALQTQITGLSGVLDGEQDKITAIEGKIPTNASTSNMLSTASDLLNATQNVRSDFAEADSELQIQINGQATAISDLSDDVMANMGEIADIKEQIKNVGGGRNIGDIFYTTRTDTELNGAVECNGATFSTSDFIGSESIGALLSGGKVPYVSLTEYQTAIDTNGSCRAFGWDGGDSFRVPTIPALLLTKEQAGVVGNGKSLGMTDGTTEYTGAFATYSGVGLTDIISTESQKTLPATISSGFPGYTNTNKAWGVTTDPTKSGIVANLDTVQYRAMVQLANKATDEALITATSALQQMANKVDKTSATDRATVVGWGMPDYSAGVSKTWNTDITASTDCFVYVLANSSLNDNICRLTVDGIVVFYDLNSGVGSPGTSCIIPIQKGSIYKATSLAGGTLIEYPLEGVK